LREKLGIRLEANKLLHFCKKVSFYYLQMKFAYEEPVGGEIFTLFGRVDQQQLFLFWDFHQESSLQ
jgi:hypothetical protein